MREVFLPPYFSSLTKRPCNEIKIVITGKKDKNGKEEPLSATTLIRVLSSFQSLMNEVAKEISGDKRAKIDLKITGLEYKPDE